jgi:hypothetical protein
MMNVIHINSVDTAVHMIDTALPQPDFTRPLAYSRESISQFLSTVFNDSQYAQGYLASNLAHIGQLLAVASKHPHPRRFIKRSIGLFSLKFQDIRYLNAYAFCSLLEDLLHHVAPRCNADSDKQRTVESFKKTIGAYLVDKFELLREEPEEALTELATHLYELTFERQDISIRELQHVLHYFLSQATQALVWSPEEQEETWYCMIAIAHLFEQCTEHNLIDKEMLDDLYWILLHRYGYFLSLAGQELTPAFYDVASTALQDMQGFWYTDEREKLIDTKATYIQKVLMQEHAASRLIAAGYIQ